MLKDKLKFKLQKTAIILICIALLAFLMQGASYFSRANQHARITQFEELAKRWQNKLRSLYPLI